MMNVRQWNNLARNKGRKASVSQREIAVAIELLSETHAFGIGP